MNKLKTNKTNISNSLMDVMNNVSDDLDFNNLPTQTLTPKKRKKDALNNALRYYYDTYGDLKVVLDITAEGILIQEIKLKEDKNQTNYIY